MDPLLRKALNETRSVLKKADAEWAKHSCPGSAECCQLKTTGRPPWLWPSEWQLLLQQGPMPAPRADGGCPFLDSAGLRCTVYAHRPLGCRTFFCHRITGPRTLPSEATNRLFDRLRALNIAVDDAAQVRSLPQWYEAERERAAAGPGPFVDAGSS